MTPLRQRMLEDMQVRNLSPHTQQSYVQRVSHSHGILGNLPNGWAQRRFARIRRT